VTCEDGLRHEFAALANPFYESLQSVRSALSTTPSDLEEHLELLQAKREVLRFTIPRDDSLVNFQELSNLGPQLGPIEEAELRAQEANIEDNEYSDHTYEDLAFEYEQLSSVLAKKVSFIESQIAANQSTGVSAEQLQEFKESFQHFDIDGDRRLSKYTLQSYRSLRSSLKFHLTFFSRLEFKSCLSSLGIVHIDFQGSDKAFEEIFKRVSQGKR